MPWIHERSFPWDLRLELALEHWGHLGKRKKEREGSLAWLCGQHVQNANQQRMYPSRVPDEWPPVRHSGREEEHGQKPGGRIGLDVAICVMLVKRPSPSSADTARLASASSHIGQSGKHVRESRDRDVWLVLCDVRKVQS